MIGYLSINRTKVEFKVAKDVHDKMSIFGINRTKVEFKDNSFCGGFISSGY